MVETSSADTSFDTVCKSWSDDWFCWAATDCASLAWALAQVFSSSGLASSGRASSMMLRSGSGISTGSGNRTAASTGPPAGTGARPLGRYAAESQLDVGPGDPPATADPESPGAAPDEALLQPPMTRPRKRP